ncbi:MAG TPA: hypothetical protein DCO79_09190 [Spirochaeta sp.]|nr:hypothetical protein [Spirochaeta sp.]
MRLSSLKKLTTSAADFVLPDLCAVCGISLAANRSSEDVRIPLCRDCKEKADNAVFNQNHPRINRCKSCGYPLTSEDDHCCRCRDKQWWFNSSSSIFLYLGIGKKLIKAYKFDNRKSLANYFAWLIYRIYQNQYQNHVVVPVPYRPSSKHRRGWDQIEVICGILKLEYKIPILKCLSRSNGRAQKTMNYSSRLKNLENRIQLKKMTVLPVKILLLDDVFTTGATMDCCACVLHDSGAVDISCIAIALDL